MDSSTSSGDDEDSGNGGEVVVMNLMIAIMGESSVLREGSMVLVEANKVVLICRGIQIIMPHRILIMDVD